MLTVQTDSPELKDFDLAHPLLALDTLDQSFLSEVFMSAHKVKSSVWNFASQENILVAPIAQRSLRVRHDE
mgnify:CR=1 FL=1